MSYFNDETGPRGDRGPVGAEGPQGQTGATGMSGEDTSMSVTPGDAGRENMIKLSQLGAVTLLNMVQRLVVVEPDTQAVSSDSNITVVLPAVVSSGHRVSLIAKRTTLPYTIRVRSSGTSRSFVETADPRGVTFTVAPTHVYNFMALVFATDEGWIYHVQP